jgi:hypothetical protein
MRPCLKMSFSVARAEGHRYLRPGPQGDRYQQPELKVVIIQGRGSQGPCYPRSGLKVIVIRNWGSRSSLSESRAKGCHFPRLTI